MRLKRGKRKTVYRKVHSFFALPLMMSRSLFPATPCSSCLLWKKMGSTLLLKKHFTHSDKQQQQQKRKHEEIAASSSFLFLFSPLPLPDVQNNDNNYNALGEREREARMANREGRQLSLCVLSMCRTPIRQGYSSFSPHTNTPTLCFAFLCSWFFFFVFWECVRDGIRVLSVCVCVSQRVPLESTL